ncbi:MAG: outer membrane protein assembly factor BamE [Alphaproteobacteria bacterium]|nr:outer membrane protein assembly factor BamE [Alphaproteobacteria bacterium]
MSKCRSFFFCILMVIALACCSTNQVGDVPSDVRVHAIKAGKHTKEDVTRLLGSPTSITLFEKESWLYIESKEQNRVFLPAKEIERKIVKITFNADGTVSKIKELSKDDGRDIAIDNTVTPIAGKDLSIIDEFIGNFGRFPASKGNGR